MALSGEALANRYEDSRVDVSLRWGIRVRRRAEAREKLEERGDEGVEVGGRRKAGSLELWRVARLVEGGGEGRRGGRVVGGWVGGREKVKRVDSALDQGPLSLAGREKTRKRWLGVAGLGVDLKGVRDEEGCGGHE